jgi:hypothetical protein
MGGSCVFARRMGSKCEGRALHGFNGLYLSSAQSPHKVPWSAPLYFSAPFSTSSNPSRMAVYCCEGTSQASSRRSALA